MAIIILRLPCLSFLAPFFFLTLEFMPIQMPPHLPVAGGQGLYGDKQAPYIITVICWSEPSLLSGRWPGRWGRPGCRPILFSARSSLQEGDSVPWYLEQWPRYPAAGRTCTFLDGPMPSPSPGSYVCQPGGPYLSYAMADVSSQPGCQVWDSCAELHCFAKHPLFCTWRQ